MRFASAREEVVRTCLELADLGYLAGTGGNVALRVDADHFAVTPSATDYYAMTAADVCVVRLADGARVEGERDPSVEAGMHAQVLRKRPGSKASIHTHQPIASAYTLLAKPLVVRDPERRRLLGPEVPCVGYAPSGTVRLARRVARALHPRVRACLMRNHGVVCVGLDAGDAVRRIAALESESAAYFISRIAHRRELVALPAPDLVTGALARALGGDEA